MQSLPILSQVLILFLGTILIPVILALTFSILLPLVFVIPGIFLCIRWLAMFLNEGSDIGAYDMKIPTFYAAESELENLDGVARVICMSMVGVVFGGIHCIGWFFNFPSSDEAVLWRVSSAVLTGTAFLVPLFFTVIGVFLKNPNSHRREYFAIAISTIILLVYVVSRLLLLVEAFISLRHLTPGMLSLVKWTSFIPHI